MNRMTRTERWADLRDQIELERFNFEIQQVITEVELECLRFILKNI